MITLKVQEPIVRFLPESIKTQQTKSCKRSQHSLRKPKVFALQILQGYLTKQVAFDNFSTVYMDKRALRPKI